MVICNTDFRWAGISPLKHDSPLYVDANGIKNLKVYLQEV